MTRLANTLKQYSAFSACFLALHLEADGQVVYVDIDPDIILNEGGQSAELDLDQNGTIDFWFHNNSFTFFSESFSSYRLMQNILVGPEIDVNSIAGETGLYGTAYSGVYKRYYPFALEPEVKIDSEMKFYNYDLQVMALKSVMSEYGGGGGVNIGNEAFWYYYLGDITIYHFLGLKFNSGEITNSYGWIRCDVKDGGRTLIIKDYAYEATADFPIIAGDTLHYVEIDSTQKPLVNIYSYQETLYINLTDSADAKVVITNLAGQHIFTFETSALTSTADMSNVASGLYIVTVEFKNKVYFKKILIH